MFPFITSLEMVTIYIIICYDDFDQNKYLIICSFDYKKIMGLLVRKEDICLILCQFWLIKN